MQNCCFKKIVTLCMLAIYLFNLAGYSFFFQWMINNNSRQTSANINTGEYSDDMLVLIKIPVLLPYSNNWSQYERYDGEVEYEGIYYHYVKRKIYNDTLHLLCLPDFERIRIQSVQDNYARQVNGVSTHSNEKTINQSQKISVISEYLQPQLHFTLSEISPALLSYHHEISPLLPETNGDCRIQPPDVHA